MTPGGHLVTTAITCGAVYAATGSVELTAGLAAGGFLIDVDHAVDYVLFDRQRDLRPETFLRYFLEGRARNVVLMLHSYELAGLLALLAWLSNWEWLWGYVLGLGLHLPLDLVFNGRFQPRGIAAFYSFAYRWHAGFQGSRLLDLERLGPVPDSFAGAFFLGPEVKAPPVTPAFEPSRVPSSVLATEG